MMGEVLPGLGAVGAAPASPPETSSTPQWGCQEPLVHWGDAKGGLPVPLAQPLTITVVARLEGCGGLQAAPQGPVATVAVVQASIDVHRVLGVR